MTMRTCIISGPRTHRRWDRNSAGEVFWGYDGTREVWCSEAEAENLAVCAKKAHQRSDGRDVSEKADERAALSSCQGKHIPADFRRMAARGLSDADIAVRMMVKVSRVAGWRAAMEKKA